MHVSNVVLKTHTNHTFDMSAHSILIVDICPAYGGLMMPVFGRTLEVERMVL